MMETQRLVITVILINGSMPVHWVNPMLMKIETLKFESQKGSVITVRQNGTMLRMSFALPLIASVTWGQKFYAVQGRSRVASGVDHALLPCTETKNASSVVCLWHLLQTDRIIVRASQQICIKLQYTADIHGRCRVWLLLFGPWFYRYSTCRRAECSPLIIFLLCRGQVAGAQPRAFHHW